MRIAILGTRGIPNHYGGFEQCAEYLAKGLVNKGHEVIVYNSHNHPYQNSVWNGVQIIHVHDPEYKVGTIGQFLYDLNCILDVRKRFCDVILQLGYSSNSIWGSLLPVNAVVTTNMDGLEWRRSKFSRPVQKFLRFAEKCAVVYSDHLISDSVGIQTYLNQKYSKPSTYIPYGANEFCDPDPILLSEYALLPYNYDLLIARLEPENSIEIILDGVNKANTNRNFLVVGNYKTKYGDYLKSKYAENANIRFLGGIYDIERLNNLRWFSNIYFHGHTVGGTNPSLLEAMASGALISANNNTFNRHILGEDALYFTDIQHVSDQLQTINKYKKEHQYKIENNIEKIKRIYSWENIVNQYEAHFENISELPSIQVEKTNSKA